MQEQSIQEVFTKRLKDLRKTKGLTQGQLGNMVGLSSRMICYYENYIKEIPSSKLPKFAKALGISIDELLGLKQLKQKNNPEYAALWRKLRKVELLPKKDQKALLDHLDALLQRSPQSEPFKIPSLHEAAKKKFFSNNQ